MSDWKPDGRSVDKDSLSENVTNGRQSQRRDDVSRQRRLQRRQTVQKLATNLPATECKARRERLGWSVQDLSSRSGFPVATLVEFEGGQRALGLSAQVALQRVFRKGARAIRP